MNYKPLVIVLGEPRSVFIEIFLKSFKILKKKLKGHSYLLAQLDS